MLRNGASVVAGNGILLEANGLSAFPGTVAADLQIDKSMLAGDVISRDGAAVDVTLRNGARLTGALTDVSSLALAGATWNITRDSNLGRLELGSGTVDFTAATPGSYKTLTVGDFSGNGGSLVFNAVLADDTSASDKLEISGDAYGPATVHVKHIGGSGADTRKGIELITVGGVSNAVFTLAGRAIVGSYEYFLHKGGAGTGTEGNWYLRSKLPTADPLPGPDRPEPLPGPDPRPYPLPGPDPDPYPLPGPDPEPCELDPAGPWCDPDNPGPAPGPDPELPGDGDEDPYPMPEPKPDPENPGDPDPILRPEGGAYLANLQAAQQMFRQGYHDRQAGQNSAGAWAKVDGSRNGFDAVSRQLDVRGNSQALSVGANVWQHESGSSAGVMLSSGNATSTSTNELTGYYARGKVKGEALGIYATWRGGNAADPYAGFYVDGSVQRAQFRNRVEGVGLETERYTSRAWQGAIEAGYAFRVGGASNGGIYLEPQLQVGYTRWDQGQHTEANGTVVQTEDANGLFGRAGVRLSGVTRAVNGGVEVQPYVAAHWLHTRAGSQIRMNDEIVDARIPQNRGEFSAGASLNFGNGFGAWGGLSLQKASGYHQTSAQVGLSYRW
ncbi:autotransporter outer membrane beta-barrel domain-containing protein [Stenotrophomonas maltophilia]